MKFLKIVALVPMIVALLSTGAFAKGYGKSGAAPFGGAQSGQSMITPGALLTPEQMQSMGNIEVFQGSLSSLDMETSQLMIKTQVPGLLGPQERDVPFRIDRDTTINICFQSINRCDSHAIGTVGFEKLAQLNEFESLASVDKNVIIVGDPEANRVVHVQVEYGL